jgi:hypothetical protein
VCGGVGGRRRWWWVGLSAHVRREGPHMLSAKSSSLAERRREAFTESFLSGKDSP